MSIQFHVVCEHTPEYAGLAQQTIYLNKGEYCARHGYSLHVRSRVSEKYKDCVHWGGISWDRLEFLLALMNGARHFFDHDWFYVVGGDTLVTNMRIPLESFLGHPDEVFLVISAEWCGPMQADSFLIRNCSAGRNYINFILGSFEKYKRHPWVEQQAMIESKAQWESGIRVLPQRRLNSYHYPLYHKLYPGTKLVIEGKDMFGNDGQWQRGDFLIHWPGLTIWDRLKLCTQYGQQIVR